MNAKIANIESPATGKSRRFNWPRIFGYDFFISFKLGHPPIGAQSYASDLARRLLELDFTVFYSEEEAPPGEKLDSTLVKALHRSRILVVVANEGALVQSQWVRKEVEEFRRKHPKGSIIPINIDHSIEKLGPQGQVSEWLNHEGRIWLDETEQAVCEGIANPDVLKRLQVAPRFFRANRLFRWLVAAIFVIISGLAVFAGYEARDAKQKFKDATAMRLAVQGSAITAGIRPGGSVRGLFKILAAHRLSPSVSADEALEAEFLKLRQLVFLRESISPIRSVAFSPDGHRIASGNADNTLRLWDAQTGQPIGPAHPSKIYGDRSVAFSPDGSRIAASSAQGGLMLLDAKTGDPIGTETVESAGGSLSVAFSPDGRRLVTSNGIVWDASTGKVIMPLGGGHWAQTIAVAFSPDSRRIASGNASGVIRLWDAQTGQPLGEAKGKNEQIWSLAFSLDGSQVVTGNGDGTLGFWAADTVQPKSEPVRAHKDAVHSVAFSPDGKMIVTGGYDKTLRLWDATTIQPIGKPLEGHLDGVASVAFSPDGRRIVSGSGDSTLRLWELDTSLPKGHAGQVSSVAFSPDGSRIVSGGEDMTLRLWDAKTGQPIGKPFAGHTSPVSSVAFSPYGKRIVSGGRAAPSYDGFYGSGKSNVSPEDNGIWLWDAETGQPVVKPLLGHADVVSSVAFSPDGNRIVSASADKTLRLWDARSGEAIGKPLEGQTAGLASVALSPDGELTVSPGNGTLRFWDAWIGKALGQSLGQGNLKVAFSPDGRRIASVSGHALSFWDGQTGEPVGTPIEDAGEALAFSPDGKRLALGSADGTLRIIEVFEGWADSLCAKLSRNTTLVEWRKWASPDFEYNKQCPDLPIPPDEPEAATIATEKTQP